MPTLLEERQEGFADLSRLHPPESMRRGGDTRAVSHAHYRGTDSCNFRPWIAEALQPAWSFGPQRYAFLAQALALAEVSGRWGLVMGVEELVGESRARRLRRISSRERIVLGLSAGAFLSVAAALALLLPSERATEPLLLLGLVFGYTLIARVRFEFGNWFVVPEGLAFVPLLLMAPLPYVPALVALAAVLSIVPDVFRGTQHRERLVTCCSDCWFSIGPVLVLAALAPGDASLDHVAAYAAALVAQFAFDFAWVAIRDRALDRLPLSNTLADYVGVVRFDAILAPIAFAITLSAVDQPLMLLTVGPLVWLLEILSRDRRERYTAALELQRAYRGTVMLLADVVEFDDQYTADHSRSVVELVHATADDLGVDRSRRQELEFAALLHDVGKIAIPKEILNKPAALTDSEFEVMKTHTIEGQFMLDRVGGLLGRVGEIVRSCHERWDGTGYPDALRGEEIPLESRIVFAADALNAMTTNRPYRNAMSTAEAIEELRAGAGTQFDPAVVDALCAIVAAGAPATASAADEVRALLARTSVAGGVGARA
jgi:HD domain